MTSQTTFTQTAAKSIPSSPRSLPFLLIGLAVWLVMNPYHGIWHDARLYSVMAMRQLLPDAFARDLWFSYGAQDGLSAYTLLFSWLTAAVGLSDAARWLTLAGGISYVIACWALLRASRLGEGGVVAFLILLSVPLSYSFNQPPIYVTESFATPRPLAISASVIALAAHLQRRQALAWLFHATALLLHPLMAIGAVAVALGAKLPERITVAGLATACLITTLLILADVGPFRAMDSYWFDLVAQTAIIVVMPGISIDQTLGLLAASTLLMAVKFGRPELRQWYLMALTIGFLGYVATLLASRFYPSALLLQVQPWRALWLTLVFAVIAAGDLVSRWKDASPIGQCGLLLLASAILLVDLGTSYLLLVAAIVMSIYGNKIIPWVARLPVDSIRWLGWLVFWCSLLSSLPGLLLNIEKRGDSLVADSMFDMLSQGLIATGGYGLIALVIWFAVSQLPKRLATLIGLIAVTLACTQWDQRIDFSRDLEARFKNAAWPEYFAGHIRQGDVVYWPGQTERIWFELRTASYAGNIQAVGIVFSRHHAMEIDRRFRRLIQVDLPDDLFSSARVDDSARTTLAISRNQVRNESDLHRMASRHVTAKLTRASLSYLCQDTALDWVIDAEHFSELAAAHEYIPMFLWTRKKESRKTLSVGQSLYDCRMLRSATSGVIAPKT